MYVLQGRGGPGMASNVGWSLLFSSLFSCICFLISDSLTLFSYANTNILMGCHRWSETVNWVIRYWRCKSSSACWSYACNTCCICDGWCSWWSSNCKCSEWFTCPVWTWKRSTYPLFGQNVKASIA
jgi:hypothetical protein